MAPGPHQQRKDEWLIFKGRDSYARAEEELAPNFDLSAATETSFPERVETMEQEEIPNAKRRTRPLPAKNLFRATAPLRGTTAPLRAENLCRTDIGSSG